MAWCLAGLLARFESGTIQLPNRVMRMKLAAWLTEWGYPIAGGVAIGIAAALPCMALIAWGWYMQ